MITKFRAWDKLNKGMCDVANIDFMTKVVELRHDIPFYFLPFSEVVLMQSTGLKDRNGVEIYDGDIVKVTDEYGDTNFSDGGIGTICGLDDLYMWYIDGQVHNGLYDIAQCYYIEVIGNIYENKELLEEFR